ncbi:pseudouridine synthase [Vitreoscilla massiliensis]|uniref:Pseudouridine synthase n=1 Tax=Vitreoscilla massiliensis TaxID=1689272 RepID=A0ABY4E5B3_9NEIS|nr:pseudouridine synthase [Vitreoscilla massiliensis]UOO90674.1 pseudouridine synthase [Vitreoscilla massiliensis]
MTLIPLAMRDGVNASCVALPNLDQGGTVLAFLQQRFPNVATEVWLARMGAGEVVDEHGVAVRADDVLAGRLGLHLYYYRDVPNETVIPFQASVIYENEHLLVADKPHFLPVMPAGEYLQQTLLVRLRREYDLPELTPLHRIDRETAGLVMFAKQESVRGAYQALFRERRIHKHYEALAPWRPEYAYPLEHQARMQESTDFFRMQEVAGEANSHTIIEVMEHNDAWARYVLSPISGKRHQLRVHMAALGMPLLYDSLYPHKRPVNTGDYAQPLQLLAKSIRFTDPISQQACEFVSQRQLLPLPAVGFQDVCP